MNRPNILLILTDQQSASMMSCTGNPNLRTPAMDQLAADGVRFESAYCTQPLCIPQRCSLFTGLMPHETGVTFNVNGDQLRRFPMMGRIFSDAGYDTGYSGKWHLNLEVADHEHHGIRRTSNIRNNGADAGIAQDLRDFLALERSCPFLFVASFNNPHNICEAARGKELAEGEIGEASPEQHPELPGNFGPPDDEPSVIRDAQERGRGGQYPTADWDEARWRRYRWQYARLVEQVDRRIGDALAALKESGQADNTLVVFTSDHGDGNGAHRWNQKQVLYEEVVRIPFIVSGPLVDTPGHVDDRHLVSMGLDLIPTLCDYAGIPAPASLRGRSLRPLIGRSNAPWRDHLVIETEFGTFGKPYGILGRCVRTARYKYMVYSEGDPREHLADLEMDPGEMCNLAADPVHAAELGRLRTLLRDWTRDTGDARFPIPE